MPLPLYATDELLEEFFTNGITVDLRAPEYADGVLTTTSGGVITTADMRVQAQHIRYTRKVIDNVAQCSLIAEGNLLVEFGDYLFVGERLEYDFQNKSGIIYDGRTAVEPWFFGGERIILQSDGRYHIDQGFLTTTESRHADWQISADLLQLTPDRDFVARQLKVQFLDRTIFWFPVIKGNLDTLLDGPIRYSMRWDKQGPRAGMVYQLLAWNRWKAFLRLDYRLTRGPGGGLETHYRSEDRLSTFETINYFARDSSLENPHEKVRYRFQGNYHKTTADKKVSVDITYDKLSDKYMATDYKDRSLDMEFPGITQLQVRHQEDSWISNFVTTFRINRFQTMKQELPRFDVSFRPMEIGRTGVISDNYASASYLEAKYAHQPGCADNNRSTRLEYTHRLYRPLNAGALKLMPQAGCVLIYYGNVPRENHRWLTLGVVNFEANMPFFRLYKQSKHVITPYVSYEGYTYPTSPPPDHFIFDITDGWYRFNMVTFGMRQYWYYKGFEGLMERSLSVDLYAHNFINTPTVERAIPKVYADITAYSSPRMRYTINTAWNCVHSLIDYCNVRAEWTYNSHFAAAVEFRHRSKYDWRKADHTNFILDSFRSQASLLHSPLSDRRDTLLLHIFCRLDPQWALEYRSRHGWNRKVQPYYTEFDVDLIGTLRSSWHIKLSYQHRENDHHRFAVNLQLAGGKPDQWKSEHAVPKLSF
jgi:hypothetical protein